MKTYEHAIDDLFEIVSPRLIDSYERINLKESTLRKINDDCKKMASKPIGDSIRALKWCVASIMLSWIVVFVLAILDQPFWIQALSGSVMFVPAIIWLLVVLIDEQRQRNVLSQEPALIEFRRVVKAVSSPPFGPPMRQLTEETMGDSLVAYAMRVLEAESKFDAVRLQKERRVWDIMNDGKWLIGQWDNIGVAFRDTKAGFGLTYDRTKIFAAAKQNLLLERVRSL